MTVGASLNAPRPLNVVKRVEQPAGVLTLITGCGAACQYANQPPQAALTLALFGLSSPDGACRSTSSAGAEFVRWRSVFPC